MSSQYTAAQFITAISGSGGIVTTIAARVGCTWNTAKKYIDTDPTVAQAYADEREKVLDRCESVLITSINDGNTQDAKWLLTKMGKHRGFGDAVDVTGNVTIIKGYTKVSPDDWDKDNSDV